MKIEGIIYGPLRSRRLGLSLGINLLPTGEKFCSFNCRYCQLGAASPRPPNANRASRIFPTCAEVSRALADALENLYERGTIVDSLTFSGNGEPTLHPHLGWIVESARLFRDIYFPRATIALFSNSSTLQRREVRQALEKVDLPIMKLDAGDGEVFRRLNRPAESCDLTTIVSGLKGLRGVILQSLFVAGRMTNCDARSLTAWLTCVAEIHPISVQVYSLDRPPADTGLKPVERPRLEEIARLVEEEAGVEAEVY